MTWLYGIVRHATKDGKVWYGLHEVYLNEGEGPSWTAEPVDFRGDTIGEIRDSLLAAFEDVEARRCTIIEDDSELDADV